MTKKIKLKQFGISPATQRKSGLKLKCCELSETKNPVCNADIPLDGLDLEDVVGVDNYFIYRIDDVAQDESIDIEVGLGYLKNKRNSLYLIRDFAFINIYPNGEVVETTKMVEFDIKGIRFLTNFAMYIILANYHHSTFPFIIKKKKYPKHQGRIK